MIVINNVSKSYGKQIIFKNINLTIDKCGFYAFIGPSGCGKSTLLSMIANSEVATSGSIEVHGKVATIYQDYQLINEFNVKDNITLLKRNINYKQICDELNLSDLIHQYPSELSGGQQQRVGIARAIAQNPDIILCDEPTESLDKDNKTIVMEYLKKLSLTKIVIIVSHDLNLIHHYVDVIYNIEDYRLHTQVLHQPSNSIIASSKHSKLNVSKILKKLIFTKEIKISILLNVLCILLVFMHCFGSKIFHVSDSKDVLNIDKLYVTIDDRNAYINIDKASNLKRIVPFQQAIIDDRNYVANIYPVVNNDNFTFKMPIDDEIIINQNLSDDVTINGSIDLVYESVDGTLEMKPFYVVDIIEEDTLENNIYYNLDTIDNVFIEENEQLEVSYSDYISQLSSAAQLDINYDDIESIYQENTDLIGYSIFHPTYEMRLEAQKNMMIFKVISYSFQVVYCLALVLFIVMYNFKANQKRLKNYALLLDFGAKGKTITHNNFSYKFKSFLVTYLVTVISAVALCYLFKPYLTTVNYIVVAFICAVVLVIYLVTTNFGLTKLNKSNVNMIIKNE